MGKLNDGNTLHRQRTSRSLLAISLAASLAAFGCTTNHNLGNGTPARSGPEVRSAPTSGVTSGGETTTPPVTNPPMMSSYTRSEALPTVTVRSTGVIKRSPDEAAAIMAGHRASGGRYLGVVSPDSAGRAYESTQIQTFVNPAMLVNPQRTVNSSISSPPNEVINTGAEGTAVATGTGAVAGATLSPTVASSGIPTVTAASAGLGRTSAQTATAATTTTTTATTAPVTVTMTPAATRSGNITSPVRIHRATTGNVTVTNVPVTTGRSQ